MDLFAHVDHLETIGGEIRINCPFCPGKKGTPDLEKKCYVNTTKQVFNCYRCGSNGGISEVIKKTHTDAEYFLYSVDSLKDFGVRKNRMVKDDAARDLFIEEAIGLPVRVLDIPARQYLYKRGLSDLDIKKYNLLVGIGMYANRIVIPTYDDHGNLVYFSARSYNGSRLKYMNAPESHKTLSSFNLQRLKQGDIAVVVEGSFSAISCASKIENSDLVDTDMYVPVAVYGKTISTNQARDISRKKPRMVILMPDDGVTKAEVSRQYQTIRRRFSGRIVVAQIPEGRDDPDECPADELISLIKHSIRFSIGI